MCSKMYKETVCDYLPPSPDVDEADECIIVKCKGNMKDPIHLPTPDSSPSKDQLDSQSDKTDTESISSCKSTEVSIKCTCRLEDRGTPSPKPSSAKVAKDSTTRPKSALDALQSPPTAAMIKTRGRGRKGRKKPKPPVLKETGNTETTQTTKTKSKSKPKSASEPKPNEEMHQKVLTDYFPVRRSSRTPSSIIKKQQEDELIEAILNKSEKGLKVVEIEGKGRGVVATKDFKRGDFVVEYAGDLIDLKLAKVREEKYKENSNIGCYMYYFSFNNKSYCVDATAESGRLGRLINHSRNGNCATKVIGIGGRPYLLLVADQNINEGEELLYDYGDRNKESLEAHPWLAL